jgi:N-acetylneuraminic acid mutarotase
MIVFGGDADGSDAGGRYDPREDRWTALPEDGAPPGRKGATAVWTGREVIAWGGEEDPDGVGAAYDPETDTWRALNQVNRPEARAWHAAVWTGREMIVWGGVANSDGLFLNSGRRYTPPPR